MWTSNLYYDGEMLSGDLNKTLHINGDEKNL